MFDMSILTQMRGCSRLKRFATHSDNMFRASLGSEHTQDSSTATNIQHCLSFEQMGVVDDSGAVGARSYGVFQHLLVNAWKIEDRVSEKTTIENVHEPTEMRIGIGIAVG
jgi:hypothetical protein